uniref:Uncharacterized protein n=1 Tax=Arundo donax TaxID=35708 RepID=A0A0A9EY29_ARUDO
MEVLSPYVRKIWNYPNCRTPCVHCRHAWTGWPAAGSTKVHGEFTFATSTWSLGCSFECLR